MTPTILIAASLTAQALVSVGMTEKERYAVMSKYIHPPPGESVRIDPSDAINKGKANFLHFKGFVQFNPPKGHCFRVTRAEEVEDEYVCTETRLSFNMSMLRPDGSLNWKISSGKGDSGYDYRWKTSHRIGQVIGAFEKIPKVIGIEKCIAHITPPNRRIVLKLMGGDRWTIQFPETDKTLETARPFPNLYIAPKKSSGGVDEDSSVAAYKNDPYLNRVKTKPSDPVTKHWAIPARGAYTMGAANFKVGETPPGMHGTCRYNFKGAASDRESGWIECHETDLYDVIFTRLPCTKAFVPQTGKTAKNQ